MVVLALVLILGAVLVSVGVLLNATGPAELDAFGVTIGTNEAGLFIAGAAAMLVLLLGVALLVVGLRRARHRHSEVKSLRKGRDSERQALQEENARLAEQARHERDLPPRNGPDDTVPRDRAVPGSP